MKNIIRKSITVITIIALTLTLAMPVIAEAATKVKLNKSKVTLTITKKKAKPTVQLKVKGTSKKAKWKSSNKKVATVSGNGKVTAKKKGTAVISVKVKGKMLKCKVVVKDTRRNASNKPATCQHKWVKHYVSEEVNCVKCGCGKTFTSMDDYNEHWTQMWMTDEDMNNHNCLENNSKTVTKCDYEYCEKCGVKKQ